MRIFLAVALLVGVTRGLYITDDRTRDPSRPLPLPPEQRSFGDGHVDLIRRQSATSSQKPTPSIPVAPSTIPTAPPSPVPTPMDLQLSYALSTPCLSYLSTLLSSSTFRSCLPFSLLLTTSTGFASLLAAADTSGNYTSLNTLLAYVTSPQPSSGACDDYMSAAYTKMGEKSTGCTADLTKRGSAVDARMGLGSAGMMRKAAGLRNPDTGSWCYLEAVASERPDDLYLWSLPTGIALPPSTKPTCTKCSSLLLNHYTTSASSTPSLNGTLVNSAITTINGACGPGFAEYSVQPPTSGASSASSASRSIGGVAVGLATALGLSLTFGLA